MLSLNYFKRATDFWWWSIKDNSFELTCHIFIIKNLIYESGTDASRTWISGPWSEGGSCCYGYAGHALLFLILHLKVPLPHETFRTDSHTFIRRTMETTMLWFSSKTLGRLSSGRRNVDQVFCVHRLNLVAHHQVMTGAFCFRWFVTLLNKYIMSNCLTCVVIAIVMVVMRPHIVTTISQNITELIFIYVVKLPFYVQFTPELTDLLSCRVNLLNQKQAQPPTFTMFIKDIMQLKVEKLSLTLLHKSWQHFIDYVTS